MKIENIKIENEKGKYQIILGTCHFINTFLELEKELKIFSKEKFAYGYCEASDFKKIFINGNDKKLKELVENNLKKINCGHIFLLMMNFFPKKIINQLKKIPEIVKLDVATGNKITVFTIEKNQETRAIIGISDGFPPINGIATKEDEEKIRAFLKGIS